MLTQDEQDVRRCFDLMNQYSDRPMDFADASIVAAAERNRTDKVFTLDRRDVDAYRIRRGHHRIPFTIVGDEEGPRGVREGMEKDCAVRAP